MDKFLEHLAPRAFTNLHFVAVLLWILIGGTFLTVFVDMEINEPRFDFRCRGAKSDNIDFVRGKCYEKYIMEHNRFDIPIYSFAVINFSLIVVVCVSYSIIVRHRVDQLLRRTRDGDPESQPLEQENASSTGRKLFIAYLCQLSTRLVLRIIFIILQTQLLYPLKFSSDFNCYLTAGTNQLKNSSDTARNSTLHECHNQRAAKKTSWMDAVLWVNIIFFAGILIEIVYILSRASLNRSFMQDSKFLKTYLNSYLIKSYKKFIKRMRDTITEETQELLELQSPFSDNPGEKITAVKHLTMDQIYTNLVLIQDRDEYKFPKNREEQLKVYPWSRDETSCPKKLKDLLNKESKKVLIIGRPGIGKTFYCTKLIRDWASGAEKHFHAAFFVKFRRFDSADELSLRELLMKSEYFPTHHLDDEVCCQLLENPKDVLILFDGFDEFRHDQDMESTYPRGIDEKKPLQILYQALVKGILLKGASVLTTTRPTALSSIKYLSQSFDKTLEVLGFSWEQIKKYVENFAGKDKQTGKTLWRHISSNLNLLSLCYVPVNSFIICSSLYPILQSNSSAGVSLPSRLTTIYKIAVKVFYFKRTREVPKKYLTSELFESDDLPDEVPEEFEKLGKVAFDGIKEGKLILGENEVRGIEDSALFHRLPDQRLNHGSLNREKQFCFIHLTMQEFFAAWHLTNKMNETELPTFVFENIQDGKWQLVFQFLAGLMDDKENQQFEIFTDLFPVKTEESESYNEDWLENQEKTKVTCWPTENGRELAVTLLKCINETSKMNTAVQRKLEQSNFNCVDFSHCHLTAVDCSSLVNVMENVRGISHFDLSGNNTGPLAGLQICKLLKCSNSQLSWLDLTGNELEDEGAKYLADAITSNNCQLRTLNLRGNNITDTGAQHLADAITSNNCQLHRLNLSLNNITATGAQHLADAITSNNCQLHRLNLSYNNIKDTGAQHLAAAITNNNCQLRTLDLEHNNITDTGALHLADAITNNNCQLHTLNLSYNNIKDTGAQHLAAAITNNNCQLRTLDLGHNKTTDTGAQHLADAITNSNCQLRTLDLSDNNIKDTGALHLADAITNNNCQLHTLNLSYNNITDTGAQHLAAAITNNNCQLRSLNLSIINISQAGKQHALNLVSNNQSRWKLHI